MAVISNADFHLRLEEALLAAKLGFEALMASPPVLLKDAWPSMTNGVYAFSVGSEIVYVGEATGLRGLRDRICSKHVSGDDGHALQAAFSLDYPDRKARREFLKNTISVQWVEIPDSLLVSLVEKLAISVLCPRFNKSVFRRNFK